MPHAVYRLPFSLNPHRRSIEYFVNVSEDDGDVAEQSLGAGARSQVMPSKGQADSIAFRQKHGLPGLNQKGGAPFSGTRDLNHCRLSRREQDVVDCAFLLFVKLQGEVPEELVIDVSQPVLREPWKCDGRCMSFHVGGKYFYQGRLLSAQTCFNMMGWPRATAVIPPGTSASAVARLLGNMVATPVIGAVLSALLREIQL
jgi:hypothetical protein